MSGYAILASILMALAPALASAQADPSAYLLRLEHTGLQSHVCVLLQKTGFFHFESEGYDSTRVLEGTLGPAELGRVENSLQDPELERLLQSQIEEPLIQRSDFLALNISRGENWQQLLFRSAESQEPYRKSLQPIMRWLDDLHKQPHKELSEDAGKNNCLAPGKIALKKRNQEPPRQLISPHADSSSGSGATSSQGKDAPPILPLVHLASLAVKSHTAYQSCVLVLSNGFYRAEERDQKEGSRKTESKITGGKFAPEEVSQFQQLLDSPALARIQHRKTSHATLPMSGEMLSLQIYRASAVQDVVLSSTFNRRDVPFFYSGDGDIASAQPLLKFLNEHVWTAGSGRLDPSLRNDCQSAP